jgi:adenylate kinase family enzyme
VAGKNNYYSVEKKMVALKKLIIIHGNMGVGKTTVCQELYKKLDNSVWLDGDWCWLMHPFVATEENKEMVMDNIQHVLGNFLKNSSFSYVIFNLVIHQEEIFTQILDVLKDYEFELYKITLQCSMEALIKRIRSSGRKEDNIRNSINRLALYQAMDTVKIDTTNMEIAEVIAKIETIISQ